MERRKIRKYDMGAGERKGPLLRVLSFALVLLFALSLASCGQGRDGGYKVPAGDAYTSFNIEDILDLSEVPEFSGSPFIVINENIPWFTTDEITDESFEYYSPLDSLGRCGTTVASIGVDLMPTEPRGSIGSVKPTGWQTVKYDFVDGKYLYNRCHLIGFQLSGENANEKNLITGTRYMNVTGMLPFENMVADYVKETENHVMYRVTPVFQGTDRVARGVLMEAYSVEDDGEGILYCVYVYNVQPGVDIDYSTGDSKLAQSSSSGGGHKMEYVLNTKTKKFHFPDCSSAKSIKEENKGTYTGTREDVIILGYEPCGNCNP